MRFEIDIRSASCIQYLYWPIRYPRTPKLKEEEKKNGKHGSVSLYILRRVLFGHRISHGLRWLDASMVWERAQANSVAKWNTSRDRYRYIRAHNTNAQNAHNSMCRRNDTKHILVVRSTAGRHTIQHKTIHFWSFLVVAGIALLLLLLVAAVVAVTVFFPLSCVCAYDFELCTPFKSDHNSNQ